MNPGHHAAIATAALASILLLAAGSVRAELDAVSAERLATLGAAPALAGELIYRGATFAQKAAGPEPLFRYERRVVGTASGLAATHLTRDPAHKLVLAESAEFNAAYQLQRFAVQNQQQGYSGVVQVSRDGQHLRYTLNDNGAISTTDEKISLPAVTGPSMYGFILAHWAELAAGKTLPVRFIVMKAKQSYGFDISAEPPANGEAAFSVTPSSWLIRRVVAPLRVVFDANQKTIVRYEGRVPPMQTVAGKLTDLDARVLYTSVAPAYR